MSLWRERFCPRLDLSAAGPVIADVDDRRRVLYPPLRFRIIAGGLRVRTAQAL
jgi:hypothetical protein